VHEALWDRVGDVQCDAGGCFDKVFARAGSRAIEVGCWMQVRRYFVEALEGADLRAAIPLREIKALYKVERKAIEAGAGPQERLSLRAEKSRPVSVVAFLEDVIRAVRRQHGDHMAPLVDADRPPYPEPSYFSPADDDAPL
jgi:hypothetical protein